MKKIAVVAAFLAGASLASEVSAAPLPVGGIAPAASDSLPVEKTQFAWGGRNYCWYPLGWRGPGWYWCGFANRRGLGWGGGAGWHGWRQPGGRGPGWHGRPGRPGLHGRPGGGPGFHGRPGGGHHHH